VGISDTLFGMVVYGALAVSALLFSSCTVLEDRSDCPCRVEVDFSSSKDIPLPVRLYALSEGRLLGKLSIYDISEPAVMELPRRGVELLAVTGAEGDVLSGILIPHGSECPKVLWWREVLETKEETMHISPRLLKQYCRLTMNLPSAPGLQYTFEGSVSGYGSDLEPATGLFSFTPEVEDVPLKSVSVCLPRQKDASLMLHVSRNGHIIRSFSVGSYMAAYGYDWDSAELSDLTLTLDFASWPLQLSFSTDLEETGHDLSI